ncbi:unnamed protein product [Oppiella nova]|uniref:Uncharacterized protein n=1 Tax=Oppiella nova TaxID=334625 RepID=A0A7R9MK93_9ACAR|nr:unnamed protein product [Oppiella nova]CAG2178936.1 unnamed protein product [Oppiella nova]
MDNFEVPTIPKIFVPQTIFTKPESQSSSKNLDSSAKSSNSGNTTQTTASNSLVKPTLHKETRENTTPLPSFPAPPQLCASCSQVLLQYFVPLQHYVNEVIKITRGGDNGIPITPLVAIQSTTTSADVSSLENVNKSSDYNRDEQHLKTNSGNESITEP